MDHPFRRCIAAACLTAASFGALAVVGPLPIAGAQEFPDPDDFIDPVTGEFDFEAYLAALAAGQQDDDVGPLPRTGSDVDSAVALGLGMVAVGGAAVIVARRRRTTEEQAPIVI